MTSPKPAESERDPAARSLAEIDLADPFDREGLLERCRAADPHLETLLAERVKASPEARPMPEPDPWGLAGLPPWLAPDPLPPFGLCSPEELAEGIAQGFAPRAPAGPVVVGVDLGAELPARPAAPPPGSRPCPCPPVYPPCVLSAEDSAAIDAADPALRAFLGDLESPEGQARIEGFVAELASGVRPPLLAPWLERSMAHAGVEESERDVCRMLLRGCPEAEHPVLGIHVHRRDPVTGARLPPALEPLRGERRASSSRRMVRLATGLALVALFDPATTPRPQ